MAKAPEARESSESAGEALAVVPSDLDDKTHAEMLMMYRECADSVRFAKSQQWTTTAGALVLFAGLGVLGEFGPHYGFMIQAIIIISMVVSGGIMYCTSGISSKPISETSSGTAIPRRYNASRIPTAI